MLSAIIIKPRVTRLKMEPKKVKMDLSTLTPAALVLDII